MLSFRLSWAIVGAGLVLGACGGQSIGTVPGDEQQGPATGDRTSTSPTTPATPPQPPQKKPTPPSDAPDEPTPPSLPPSTPPPACNAVVNDATTIGITQVATAAPTPAGGAIANGKYHLTDVTMYTGPGGAAGPFAGVTIQSTIYIQGNVVEVIQKANGKEQIATEAISTSGAQATFAQTCPSAGPPSTVTYSAFAGTLVMYIANDPGKIVAYTYAP